MKLKDLSNLIVFDEFPLKYIPQQKIVLTHLLHLEKRVVPAKIGTIYTTHFMAKQLKEYYKLKGSKNMSKINFTYVEPYKYIDIVLSDHQTLQLLFCESQEYTRNLMVLIREGGKLKYIYAGNFLDIRTALFNDTFASWVEREAAPQLYLNLKRSQENPQVQDVDPINKVIDAILQILEWHTDSLIHMYLPLFGYDNFIHKLTYKFPKRISLSLEYKPYPNINKELLADNLDKAKIVLFPGESPTTQVIRRNFKKNNQVVILIQEEYKSYEDMIFTHTQAFYSLYYTPEPTPFHLQLLCLLLKPKRLVGIIDTFNINSAVPSYLIELCNTTPLRERHKRLSRFNESLRALTPAVKKVITVGPETKPCLFLDDSESD